MILAAAGGMNNILTCLDASPRAEHVLRAAIAFAQKVGGRLTLFRSVGLPHELTQGDVFGMTPNAIMDHLVADARASLAIWQKDVPPAHFARLEVRTGTPWSAICAEAKEHKADLIVIGSHGYSGMDRILGTTAAKVVNHAECSVLVVR